MLIMDRLSALLPALLYAAGGLAASMALETRQTPVVVFSGSATLPGDAVSPVLDNYLSYSFEFSSFVDYFGNSSKPNQFTAQLLQNIATLTGSNPLIRVGGNTQDFVVYNGSQHEALIPTFIGSQKRFPKLVLIGSNFFDSFHAIPNTRYSMGLNMAQAFTDAGWKSLQRMIPTACKALLPNSKGVPRFYMWEFGNEPDMYVPDGVRPATYNAASYVAEWLNGTRMITSLIKQTCSNDSAYTQFMAPSITMTTHDLKANETWLAGQNTDHNIPYFAKHNYIGDMSMPGLTLEGWLANHAKVVSTMNQQLTEYSMLRASAAAVNRNNVPMPPPLIMGEFNSISSQGIPGLSNVFGAALWGLDTFMYGAANGFKRMHMHMGTDYLYSPWQAIHTEAHAKGTHPPYYANMAVAAALGNTATDNVSVVELTGSGTDYLPAQHSAYAIYRGPVLIRVMIINMKLYNTTLGGTGLGIGPVLPRGNLRFSINLTNLGGKTEGTLVVQRLMANGSDALSGVTWDGWSFNWELAGGRPVWMDNVTTGEVAHLSGSSIGINVPDSSAVLLTLDKPYS